jgi:hypothetical protein
MNTTLEASPASSTQKSWLAMALLYGLPMALVFLFVFGADRYLIALPAGLIAGVLFASSMSSFANGQTQKFQAESPDFGCETTLHAGPANHFKGLESVGGHLWLTSGRLHFRSHKMNLQNHEWSAPLADITSAHAIKTLGLIRNGLSIRLTSGEEHRFVVGGHERWVQDITSARQALAA